MLEQAAVVEPVDPFECCVFDGLEAAPRASAVDDLSFEQADDRLSEGVVIAVADAADRRFDTRFCQSFGVFDGQILGGFNRSSQYLRLYLFEQPVESLRWCLPARRFAWSRV